MTCLHDVWFYVVVLFTGLVVWQSLCATPKHVEYMVHAEYIRNGEAAKSLRNPPQTVIAPPADVMRSILKKGMMSNEQILVNRLSPEELAYTWYWWTRYGRITSKSLNPVNTLASSLNHFRQWNVMLNFEDTITCNNYTIQEIVSLMQKTVDRWFDRLPYLKNKIRVQVVAIRYKLSIQNKILDLKSYLSNHPSVDTLVVKESDPNFREESLWQYCTFYKGPHVSSEARRRYRSPKELQDYKNGCKKFYHTIVSMAGPNYWSAHATPHYLRFFEAKGASDACAQPSVKNWNIWTHEFGHALGLPDLFDDYNFPATIKGSRYTYEKYKIQEKSMMYYGREVQNMDIVMMLKAWKPI